MPNFIFSNNIDTTLAGAVSNTATTITLASTANLPSSIPAGYVLAITLNDAATENNYEVVYATAITGATLTVQRAQEGTSALSWLVGDYAYSGPTAGQQESFAQTGGNNTWTGMNVFDEPVVVPDAVTANEAINLEQAEQNFAALNGSPAQTFDVANATEATQAVALGQFGASLGLVGHQVLPNGLIIQWGAVNGTTTENQDVVFNIPFPNRVFSIAATCENASGPLPNFVSIGAFSNNDFRITTWNTSGLFVPASIQWIATGY